MVIYLDHNATTPVDPEVLGEMLPYFQQTFGNPSSIHQIGQQARRGLDLARERIGDLVGANPKDIVLTSGGTESNNTAIFGVCRANHHRGDHIVTTAIEHHAVLSPCDALKAAGARVTFVGVDEFGAVDPQAVIDAMTDETVLVSVMAANNDVGTLQPVTEIARAARLREIVVHCDAVQLVGKLPTNVEELGADLISFSSHKLYGPKGAGALYVRRDTPVAPLLHGGHHEAHRRAGTENVPAIVGFGKACELAKRRLVEDSERIRALRDRLETGIQERFEGCHINGHPENRLPGTLNVSFDAVDGETLVIALDVLGVATSTGSACSSGSTEPSHVLQAMGASEKRARSSVRFSLGRTNTEEHVGETLDILNKVIGQIKNADASITRTGMEK